MNNGMTAEKIAQAMHDRFATRIRTVDSHTGGEATRLILAGTGPIPGSTMNEKRAYFQDNLDHIRLLLTREPRGHRDIVAAMVTEPVTPGAAFGLIYMDACRYPHLCGHATIGAVTTLLELGLLTLPEGSLHENDENAQRISLLVDTPSGTLSVAASMDGPGTSSVTLTSVPAFVFAKDVFLEVPTALFGLDRLRIDLVCVGGFFAMVDLDQPGLDLDTSSSRQVIDLGMHVIRLANEQLQVRHPVRPDVVSVDVAEFYRHTGCREGHGFVVYGESHMDRSPCGTGTTAKMTLLHHKGLLEKGIEYRNSGPLKTVFNAHIHETTFVGDFPALTVRFTGSAQITGRHEFVLDPRDPFPRGFLL